MSTNKNIERMKTCICCGSDDLTQVLDLNEQPLANSYHDNTKELEKYPLGLNLCNNCTHLQLTHCVNPDLLFKDYLYVSGTSQTLKNNMEWFANWVLDNHYRDVCRNVLDIACNDGTQLDYFKNFQSVYGWNPNTYGIDPAENLYEDCKNKGHNIQCCYFGEHKTDDFPEEGFDVIIAQNVFAHNRDAKKFLQDCSKLMHEDSVLYIQTSQANMILENQFDTIYHEHLSFFNINSMNRLVLGSHSGLELTEVHKSPVHGISYIFVITKNQNRIENSTFGMQNHFNIEQVKGLYDIKTYDNYRENVLKITRDFTYEIESAKEDDYTIIGYGAAAKGMTFLNFADVQLDYIIDDNPLKQNLYTPGTNIEIKSIELLEQYDTDGKILFVPLAWNFYDEIKTRILKVRDNENDRFLRYFPSVKVEK